MHPLAKRSLTFILALALALLSVAALAEEPPEDLVWSVRQNEDSGELFLVNDTPIYGVITGPLGQTLDAALVVNLFDDRLLVGVQLDGVYMTAVSQEMTYSATLVHEDGFLPVTMDAHMARGSNAIRLDLLLHDTFEALMQYPEKNRLILKLSSKDGTVMEFPIPHNGTGFSDAYDQLHPQSRSGNE